MSKALELAAQMDEEPVRTVKQDIMHSDAAAELRRLDAENKTLRDALIHIQQVACSESPELSIARAALGETK